MPLGADTTASTASANSAGRMAPSWRSSPQCDHFEALHLVLAEHRGVLLAVRVADGDEPADNDVGRCDLALVRAVGCGQSDQLLVRAHDGATDTLELCDRSVDIGVWCQLAQAPNDLGDAAVDGRQLDDSLLMRCECHALSLTRVLSAEKVIALQAEWNITVQPSGCLCRWVATLWTAAYRRLVGTGGTPALAVEDLMAKLSTEDKPLRRTCKG